MRALVARSKKDACIILTTPHPSLHWLHTLGAAFGIFSRRASEEHWYLLDRQALERLAEERGLQVAEYRRFLLGANQLVVLRRARQIL